MKRIVVIGGGPGGYVAAIRAAQLGAEVHLAEKQTVGGTCLNVGCIPTKALLHAAEVFRLTKEGSACGIKAVGVNVDWRQVQANKRSVVKRLVGGVESLLKANGVMVHRGSAVLYGDGLVQIFGEEPLQSDAVILATGSLPIVPPIPGADLSGVIDSTQALALEAIPASLAIIGGGVIGVEFASLYRSFGTEVSVIEMMPEILPANDRDIAHGVRGELTRQGVRFLTGTKVQQITRYDGGLRIDIALDGAQYQVEAQYVLVAAGRRPNTDGMGLDAAGVVVDRGKVKVDADFRTSVPGIYAVGDCNGLSMLAHAASAQGIAAAEHAMGHRPAYHASTIPACVYTRPEAAGVGITEQEAVARRMDFRVGKFPLTGNGKALIENNGAGLIKIISGARYGEILGVHIFGPRATDLIAEAALALRLEATVDELISTIHPHPTVSEAVAEAALAVSGSSIHWPPSVR